MPELGTLHNASQNTEFQVDCLIRDVSCFSIRHVGPHHFHGDAVQLYVSERRAKGLQTFPLSLHASRSKVSNALAQILFGSVSKSELGKLLADGQAFLETLVR